MATGDVILARVNARFDGEPINNSLAFVDTGSDGTDFLTTAAELHTFLTSSLGLDGGAGGWIDGLSVQYSLVSMQYIDVVPGTAPMVEIAVGQVGTVDDDDAMPPNDSMCITWRSAFKGPSGRGRTYLNGFAEGSANGGYWEAGAQSHADTIAASIIANHGEAGGTPIRFVILHRMSGGEPIVPPEQKPVMSYTVHNEVRSIGRRAVGRRIHRTRA